MSIIDQLSQEIDASGVAKSSHWKHHTAAGDGHGVAHRAGPLSNVWHWAAQRLLFPLDPIFRSSEYRETREWCRKQGRALNMDNLRHVFTHRLLARLIDNAQAVCVIGDGQGNFAGPLLARRRHGQKMVSVNLPEILIEDHKLIECSGAAQESEIAIVASRPEYDAAMADDTIRLILVPAHRSSLLQDADIDLFVNIASFQEMTPALVGGYFDLVKSNRAVLYCCNRVEKILYGGERLVFDQYPWGDGYRTLWELCPWHQRYYSKRPPFIRSYDGPIMHALVSYQDAAGPRG